MNCAKIETEQYHELLDEFNRIEDVDLGLNPFAMVADEGAYCHEKCHSKIIAKLLDPETRNPSLGKPQGTAKLKAFVKFLGDVATERKSVVGELLKDVNVTDQTRVAIEYPIKTGENGFIDVLIWDEKNNWSIIIENKINGAPDMKRQLPRYIEFVRDELKCHAKAVVYLTACEDHANVYPDMSTWKKDGSDKKLVDAVFLPIAGWKQEGQSTLAGGWLEKVKDKGDRTTSTVVQFYIELLEKQAEDCRRDLQIEQIVRYLDENACATRYEEYQREPLTQDFSSSIPGWAVRRFVSRCQRAGFTKLFGYKNQKAVFEFLNLQLDDAEKSTLALKIDVDLDLILKARSQGVKLYAEGKGCTGIFASKPGLGKRKKALAAIRAIVCECDNGCSFRHGKSNQNDWIAFDAIIDVKRGIVAGVDGLIAYVSKLVQDLTQRQAQLCNAIKGAKVS